MISKTHDTDENQEKESFNVKYTLTLKLSSNGKN